MTALFLVGTWAGVVLPFITPAPIDPPPPPPYGYISSYSCDNHPDNPMHPCGKFRDGSTPDPSLHGLVAACPLERLGQSVWVDGWGVLRCVDTPRTPYVDGMAHIDVFTTFPEAEVWGIQTRRIQWIAPIVGQSSK